MPRYSAFGLVALATLVVGCGGGISGLLATVPPPVELTGGSTGLMELPAQDVYRGDLKIERVTMVRNDAGSWTEESVTTVEERSKAQATVGSGNSIDLRLLDATEGLFTGNLRLVRSSIGVTGSTTATLTAFDGHKEKYSYRLLDGSPKTFEVAARANIEQDEKRYSFDRYKFSLQQND